MSCSYYYFVASLPTLSFEKPANILYAAFLKDAQQHLDPGDFDLLDRAVLEAIDSQGAHPFLDQWTDLNRRLKNEIVRFRAKKFGQDPGEFTQGDGYVPLDVVERLGQIMKIPNPLQAEKAIDQLRWEKLDEYSVGHSFDLEVLMVYGLKLQILDRYHVIHSGQGEDAFERYHQVEIFEKIQV